MDTSRKLVGHLACFVAIIFFSLNVPATKYILDGWLDAWGYTLLRVSGGALFCWIGSLFVKQEKVTTKKDWLTILLGGTLGLSVFFFCFSFGMRRTSPIDASILLTLSPVVVMVVAAIAFREKITLRKSLGLIIAMAGALMVILMQGKNGNASGMEGNIVILISACLYGIYLVFTRGISQRYNPAILLRWMFLSGFIFSLPFCIDSMLHSQLIRNPQSTPLLVALFIALGPSALAYMLLPLAMKSLTSTVVSMYNYAIPILASAVSILLHQATLRWDEPIATLLVILGVYFVTTRPRKSKPIKNK